jgi:hypothetical protein
MRNEFNTYHWRENRVIKRDDIPNVPHFQALVFGTRHEWTPPYGRHDDPSGSTSSLPTVDVYVFKARDELSLFIDEATRTGVSFVFFAVSSLGKATVNVDIDLEV